MTKSGSYALDSSNTNKNESSNEDAINDDKQNPVVESEDATEDLENLSAHSSEHTQELFEVNLDGFGEPVKQVKCPQRFRFILSSMAVLALTICIINRAALNVAINSMTESPRVNNSAQLPAEVGIETSSSSEGTDIESLPGDPSSEEPSKPIIVVINLNDDGKISCSASTSPNVSVDNVQVKGTNEWSSKKQQVLLAAFYIGYFPLMLISGYLAEVYGSKNTLLIATVGTGIVNVITPSIVSSFTLLLISRMVLGCCQSTLVPGLYAFINIWLTETEINIFASMIKVALALGVCFGFLIKGILFKFNYGWPIMFYFESSLCLVWGLVWYFMATSTPGENKYVAKQELEWIQRKKKTQREKDIEAAEKSATTNELNKQSISEKASPIGGGLKLYKLMLSNPSVWALAVTKFTHNVAHDFILIELTYFLEKLYKYPTSTITTIACLGSLSQVFLLIPVSWISKVVVQKRVFGLSKTKWRKAFQGFSNFGLSLILIILACKYITSSITMGFLVVMYNIFQMFGVGGEAVAANDMSLKYPATIYGFAHSAATLAGIAVPITAGIVVSDTSSFYNWSKFFIILASSTIIGGLAFILGHKSKRFLPGEVEIIEKNEEHPTEMVNIGTNK